MPREERRIDTIRLQFPTAPDFFCQYDIASPILYSPLVRLSLSRRATVETKVPKHALRVQPHDAVQALLAQQVGHGGLVVLEEVFGEGGCAFRMDEDVEIGFLVGVVIGMVCAEGSLLTVVEAVLLVCIESTSKCNIKNNV